MTFCIVRADFSDPALGQFLEDHHADMAPHSPAESQHALGLESLRRPGVRLWVGKVSEQLVATCALAPLAPGHEELKSMRTLPSLRGRGIASQLLEHAIADAAARGISRISLETGSAEFFATAHKLYLSNGFEPCEPFGSYGKDLFSIYMTQVVNSPAPG